MQPRFEQQLELPQLTVQFSLAELLFAAYVGASWLQSNPCPSRFLDLSVMDDVFNRASGKCASFVSENCCLFIVYKILYFLHATINCFLFHYDCLFHIFSSAASLQPAELIVCVTDVCLSVWMPSSFFQIAAPCTVFPVLTKLGTRSMCHYAKICGTDFQNFDLKFLANF